MQKSNHKNQGKDRCCVGIRNPFSASNFASLLLAEIGIRHSRFAASHKACQCAWAYVMAFN